MSNSPLYFDIAATTPLDKDVANLMNTINLENFGNPSSIHSFGQKSHNIVERSREKIAKILNCKSSELFFTSGGSESNNIVLKGVLEKGDHFITSSYEHPSVLGLTDELQEKGIEVTFIKPNQDGMLNALDIKKAFKENTKMVSIMYVNNELGTINPIKDIAQFCNEHNILFHTDAVQYVGKKNINLNDSHIDFLSIGAHKFYGPKGIGLLYCKSGKKVNPLISGGGQESGLRAGTENISSIAGMALALEIAHNTYDENKKNILELENYFIDTLNKADINYRVNGSNRLAGIFNITFFNVQGHSLLMNLDIMGIAISYGSACSSGSANAPLALLEIGMPKEEAACSVRISIGKMITKQDIDKLIKSLSAIIVRIQKK
ncbi:MAG: cysteine desulfurase NifS [Candidatus Marinimicrobia bacterium]|nr:cysteine desulfurase NifS [Candidatus Neomarinimicrobiota bacterium]|tara:strand:- start:5802 stop:6932 length:1131 start_codon:yes stop_codon:yes gene_type:complete